MAIFMLAQEIELDNVVVGLVVMCVTCKPVHESDKLNV
jgi:hypothetical protein